jgi:hypothetical protein
MKVAAQLSELVAALLVGIPGITAVAGRSITRNLSRQNGLRLGISADENNTPTSNRPRLG